ncbi:MAG TPA: HD domain-containing phosphohydrolase [bacterium]|nr:HD domain-containing phosphohydrolase [bacterium]
MRHMVDPQATVETPEGATPAESPVAAIARALLVLTEADHAAIFFRSPTGIVTCPWSHNLSERYVAELVTPNGVNPWIHILRHPELTCMDLPKARRRADPAPWIVRDVLELSSDHAALVDRFVRENLRSMCVWPLSRAGRVVAALAYYYDAPHEYSEEDQEGMRAFAAQATTALGEGIAQSIGDAARGAGERIDTHTPPAGGPAAQHTPAAAQTGPGADRASLEAEQRRLADAQAALAQQNERLEQARRMLEADTDRLAGERKKLATAWQEVEAAQARGRDARAGITAEQQRLADAHRRLETERAQLVEARAALDAERARRESAGAEQAAARIDATDEEARLSESRRLLHEENVRLEALRRDLDAERARLAGDRASLEAERQALDTERARAAQTQTQPEAEDVAQTQPPEAGATTYRSLVERAGAANVPDDDARIVAVARRLDAHNGHVADFSKRLAEWAVALARALRCSDPEILSTRRAALLHDIGKIDVPEATLKKAAGLTDDERNMFEREPAVAHRMLKDVEGLGDVAAILRHRFERWDGAGRPDRLKGDAIPLGARILSVVDAYGEMITGRPGVPKLYYRDAIAALRRESGVRFDPEIAAAFCRIVAHG